MQISCEENTGFLSEAAAAESPAHNPAHKPHCIVPNCNSTGPHNDSNADSPANSIDNHSNTLHVEHPRFQRRHQTITGHCQPIGRSRPMRTPTNQHRLSREPRRALRSASVELFTLQPKSAGQMGESESEDPGSKLIWPLLAQGKGGVTGDNDFASSQRWSMRSRSVGGSCAVGVVAVEHVAMHVRSDTGTCAVEVLADHVFRGCSGGACCHARKE